MFGVPARRAPGGPREDPKPIDTSAWTDSGCGRNAGVAGIAGVVGIGVEGRNLYFPFLCPKTHLPALAYG